jgi:L-malate glycosyltransferase
MLGICGPIELEPFRAWLTDPPLQLPRGMGGTPVVDLARAALDRGWRVCLFSLDEEIREELIFKGPRLKICMGPFRPRHRARDLFRAERAYLSHAIRRENPEAVHAHWTYEFALGALESGAPTVVTAHDAPLSILRLNPTPYRLVRTLMAYQVARRAQPLTAVSEHVAGHFQRYLRHRAPIRIIPNGILPEWFDGTPRGTAGPITYVSVLNGWGKLKNTKTLVEAFQLTRKFSPSSRLLLFGAGHGPSEEAEVWSGKHGLSENVSFRGVLDRADLLNELKLRASILVHPSLEESFGMSVAEGMALGIPVIAGKDSGAMAEMLEHGESGVLTEVRSATCLSRDMLRLANDPDLRVEFARKGHQSATQRFRMDHVLDAYGEVYREVSQVSCVSCTS